MTQTTTQHERVDIAPDVMLMPFVVEERSVLYHASRTARRLFSTEASWLDFSEDDSVLHLNWMAKGTSCTPSFWDTFEHKRAGSFIKCAEKLIEVAEIDRPKTVNLFKVEVGSALPLHQDKYDGSRTLLLLEGTKAINLIHKRVTAQIEWIQLPGDAYKMTFTNNEDSLLHAVQNVGEVDSIAMYVNG